MVSESSSSSMSQHITEDKVALKKILESIGTTMSITCKLIRLGTVRLNDAHPLKLIFASKDASNLLFYFKTARPNAIFFPHDF